MSRCNMILSQGPQSSIVRARSPVSSALTVICLKLCDVTLYSLQWIQCHPHYPDKNIQFEQ